MYFPRLRLDEDIHDQFLITMYHELLQTREKERNGVRGPRERKKEESVKTDFYDVESNANEIMLAVSDLMKGIYRSRDE